MFTNGHYFLFLDDDGTFIYRDHHDGSIILKYVANEKKKVLVDGKDLIDVSI
jgi:hypothetical protein